MTRRAHQGSAITGFLLAFLVQTAGCGPTPGATAPTSPTASVRPAASETSVPPKVIDRGPETAEAPTKRAVGSGQVIVPTGWAWKEASDGVLVIAPDADLRVVFVPMKEADPDAAVAAAWALFPPKRARKLQLITPRPGTNGFSERKIYDYETSPNEKMVVYAKALRGPDGWTVQLVEGSESTYERRSAALSALGMSLTAKGYQKESFAGKKPLPLDKGRQATLVRFVEEAQRALQIPGVGLVLIENGEVVLERGLGVRELGKPTKVDKDTRFAIASNTKGMTTLLLSTLVDEHKLDWDTPVTKLYPGFRLGDAATTDQVLVKHLVCACTGLPRQDLEWIFEYGKQTPKDTFTLLGTMQPTTKFGETFQYSNLLASAAGYLAGHVISPQKELGAAYDEAMRKRIFGPLGMKTATLDLDQAIAGNHASAHGDGVDGKVAILDIGMNRTVMPHRPAGGAWMSAGDLAKYAQLELRKGALPGGQKRLVEESSLLARRAPQIALGEDATYGMGLEVETKWGTPMLHHGGSLFGYKSDWMVLPEHGLGAVLLTNSDQGGALLGPFFRRFVEVVFDGKPEAEADLAARAAAIQASLAKERERLTIPADATLAAKLASKYGGSALGELTVTTTSAGTVFDLGEWKTAVASHVNDDGTVSFLTSSPELLGVDFVVGEKDGKRTLTVRDAQHEYVFVER
jgi:CubicO group peptidase (beta-lactamase class C family)